ncbi:MAG TPA: hypothetical protein VN034_14975 [Sphingopyxis sp.]|nr:hypothetical protein [Sphingopyxis sp.]
MKKLAMICIAALASASTVAPAFAQHITPASTPFTFTGPAVLNKPGFPTSSCTLTLTGITNPTLGLPAPHVNHTDGASVTGGTNTGGGACPAITVGPADISYNSTTSTWQIEGLKVYVGPNLVCDDAGPIAFGLSTSGGVSTAVFNSTVDPDCNVMAELTSTDVQAVP